MWVVIEYEDYHQSEGVRRVIGPFETLGDAKAAARWVDVERNIKAHGRASNLYNYTEVTELKEFKA